jgi:hypothetical protein
MNNPTNIKGLVFFLGLFLILVGAIVVVKAMFEAPDGQYEAVKSLRTTDYPTPGPAPRSR